MSSRKTKERKPLRRRSVKTITVNGTKDTDSRIDSKPKEKKRVYTFLVSNSGLRDKTDIVKS